MEKLACDILNDPIRIVQVTIIGNGRMRAFQQSHQISSGNRHMERGGVRVSQQPHQIKSDNH